MTERKQIDWEAVERDYRAGILSIREIGKQHGVSHVMIGKKAKEFGWTRDLADKINAKADELVTKQGVTSGVTTRDPVTEREIVEANAATQAQVRLTHRKDVERARKLSMKLLDELENQTDNLPLFQQLGEMLRREDDKGVDRLNDIYQAVISLPERTKTMKALSETLKHLIGLEREAYGISNADGEKTNGMKLVTVKDYTGRG